jgi:citrate synthase
MTELAAARDLPPPNVDLALAALTWVTGMPADAGVTLFTVARVAGWTAHYLEELTERPLRFRARAVYASPADVGSAGGPDDQGARSSAEGDGRPH